MKPLAWTSNNPTCTAPQIGTSDEAVTIDLTKLRCWQMSNRPPQSSGASHPVPEVDPQAAENDSPQPRESR